MTIRIPNYNEGAVPDGHGIVFVHLIDKASQIGEKVVLKNPKMLDFDEKLKKFGLAL